MKDVNSSSKPWHLFSSEDLNNGDNGKRKKMSYKPRSDNNKENVVNMPHGLANVSAFTPLKEGHHTTLMTDVLGKQLQRFPLSNLSNGNTNEREKNVNVTPGPKKFGTSLMNNLVNGNFATNLSNSSMFQKSSKLGKTKQDGLDFRRRLFHDEMDSSIEENGGEDYDEIENSNIEGFINSDADTVSEDFNDSSNEEDCNNRDEDVLIEQYNQARRRTPIENIPSNYTQERHGCHYEQIEFSDVERDDSSNDSSTESDSSEDFDPRESYSSKQPPNSTTRSKVPVQCNLRVLAQEYASLGPPTCICSKCGAVMWKEERVNKQVTKGIPKFSLCCAQGQVKLSPALPTPPYLMQLYNDKEKGPAFQRSICLYNTMFSFTSTGGHVDHSINNGGAPYVYRLTGQNHHVFGSLIPDDGVAPKFAQLYIYDTVNEVTNRMRWVNVKDKSKIDAEVVTGLMNMLDGSNELVKEFRMTRDRFANDDFVDLKITLKISRSESGRENHVGPSDEVAGIMVGDMDETCGSRDVIVHSKVDGLKRVSDIHPKLMALQYPLLFPNGGDGYHVNIDLQSTVEKPNRKRKKASMKDYYSYEYQVRPNEGMTPRLGGRLFQQYVVDAFSTIEQARLWWFRINQTILRNELYSHICDSVQKGDSNTENMGKGFILPAGFVGSKRYMQQNFQDALAVCRYAGHPDIFLTMTCNSMWDEIQRMMEYLPGCIVPNSPDIISRVFKLKLEQLTDDIKKKSYFGKCVGVMFVVEFQKRGLPHVHMLIWLDSASKKYLKENVDKFVSAEIPDPEKDSVGYAAVKSFMIHGPCGLQNRKSACMKNFKCIRHFPKKYCPRTIFDDSGFPLYMRRKTKFTINVRKAVLDNQWVVPYNRGLLVKYQCHINVEICCHARSLKYLFKYCLKGHDRATVEVIGHKRPRSAENIEGKVDEIQSFFDGRYICGCEAAYRIFGFDIHHRSLSVERLPFHLPDQKNCTFRATEPLSKVAEREKDRVSKLEAFFLLNSEDINARKYTYDEIPRHYVWNDRDRRWNIRKRGFKIGRLSYTHHSSGEVWYLRLLLLKVRGPTSFKSLRIVNGVLFSTFREACNEYGLLDDDNEWHEVLRQASVGGLPPQIRQLFVHIIVNCKVTDLRKLWTCHWKHMSDDILYIRRKITGNQSLILNDKQLEFYVLADIDTLLKSIGKSVKHFCQLRQPPSSYLHQGTNNLIMEETNYNITEMEERFYNLFSKLNEEQLNVFNAVLGSVTQSKGGVFFVYGSGGCGKTYLWRTLITKLRSIGKIVLPVASSGIAATLMEGGRTVHSRFKVPIVLDQFSLCNIGHNSDIAELIKQTSLIIWDEAPMQHRYTFECLDRSLRDIMNSLSSYATGIFKGFNHEESECNKLSNSVQQTTTQPSTSTYHLDEQT